MIYRTFPVGSFQCNCSLLACEETKEAILIDPGDEAEKILPVVRELGVKVLYAIHTHAHLDHIGATKKVSEETGCEILLHKEDLFLYENLQMQASLFGLEAEEPTPPHRFVDDEEEITFGKCRLEVIHTPGHTPGSICFQIEEAGPSLFTGDTLFQNGIGRTDLWGGSFEKIIDSIKGRILQLDDDTAVHPGHGPSTTVGDERRKNPFLI